MLSSDNENLPVGWGNAPLHYLLRVPLMTRLRAGMIFTIDAHISTASELGHVSCVKFGATGPKHKAEFLRKQIQSGQETLILLVAKKGRGFIGWQAALSSIHFGGRTPSITKYMPSYYYEISAEGGLWFIADAPFSPSPLESFCLASNKRPILDVLYECRTSSMMVLRKMDNAKKAKSD